MGAEATTSLLEFGALGIFVAILCSYIYFLHRLQKGIQERHHTERISWIEKSDKQFEALAVLTKETNGSYTANATAVSELRGVMQGVTQAIQGLNK